MQVCTHLFTSSHLHSYLKPPAELLHRTPLVISDQSNRKWFPDRFCHYNFPRISKIIIVNYTFNNPLIPNYVMMNRPNARVYCTGKHPHLDIELPITGPNIFKLRFLPPWLRLSTICMYSSVHNTSCVLSAAKIFELICWGLSPGVIYTGSPVIDIEMKPPYGLQYFVTCRRGRERTRIDQSIDPYFNKIIHIFETRRRWINPGYNSLV